MSTTIDEKVVEMRFDNKEFESNVQASMSTLDKLKQSLNFDGATKGFDSISKAAGQCDVSALGTAAESVSLKFSALQVVAVTALQNITNSAISAGEQLLSSLSVDNVVAGWEKYGNKTTSVATLVAQGYDLDEVTEQLERLNWYTDETSYNFTDMVANIAKFTASGQDLNTSVTAMEGIANWAALSGQNATTASNAMYQLAQAMSAGYMRLEDYKSVQNASMDTEEFRQKCIDAAVALGTLKDNADGTYTSVVDGAQSSTFTLSSFTTGLTKGAWLTSDVMMDVFNDYSNAVDQIYEYAEEKGITASEAIAELGDEVDEFGLKAFKAAQEARTWADVIDSVKDAVSTAWMNTFELIFGNYEEATELWTELANTLYDVFAEPMNVFNEFLEAAMDSPFGALLEHINDVSGATEAMTAAVADYSSIVDEVINGSYGNGQARWDALTEAGYDWAYVQNLVNEELGNSTRHATDYEESIEGVTEATEAATEAQSYTVSQLAQMTNAELKALGLSDMTVMALKELARQAEKTGIPIEDLAEDLDQLSGRSLLIDSFRNIGQSLLNVMQAISNAWNDIFPAMASSQLYDIIAAFHKFTTYLEINEDRADKITRTFKGLFAVIDIITTTIGGAFKIALKVVSKMLGMVNVDILDVTASVGDAIVAFHDWLLSDSVFGETITFIAESLLSCIDAVHEWAASFMETPEVQANIEEARAAASDFFTTLKNGTNKYLPSIQSALSWLSNAFTTLWDTITIGIQTVQDWITEFKDLPGVQAALADLSTAGSNILTSLGDSFSSCAGYVSTFIEDFKSMDSLSLDNLKATVTNFIDNVVGSFTNIGGISDNLEVASASLATLADAVVSTGDTDTSGLDTVKDALESFLSFLEEKFSGVGIGSILTVGLGIAVFSFVKKLTKFADSLAGIGEKLATGIEGVLSGTKTLLSTLTSTIKSFRLPLVGAAVLMIAGAIAILVVALIALTRLADKDMLIPAAGAMFVIALGLSILTAALSKLTTSGKLIPAAAMLIALSASMLILAGALAAISSIPTEQLLPSLGALAALALGLVAVMAALVALTNVMNPLIGASNMAGIALGIVGFAVALYILVQALSDVDNLDLPAIQAALPMLAEIMVGLGVVAALCGSLGIGSAIGMLTIIASLKLLLWVLDDIAVFDADKIYNNIEALILVFGAMFGLMFSASIAGANAAAAGVGAILMAASLVVLIQAIKMIADIPEDQLGQAVGAIAILLVVFTLIIAASNLAGEHAAQAGVMLLLMSAAILILVAAMALLVLLIPDESDMWRAVAAVSVLIVLMAVLVAATALANGTKEARGTIMALVAAVAILAIALGALSMVTPENLMAATGALAAVMGVLAVLVASTALAKNASGTLIILAVIVAGLAAVLYLLSSDLKRAGSALVAAEAISLLLIAMSAALTILSAVKSVSSSAMQALAEVTLVVIAIAVVFEYLSTFNVNVALDTALGLSVVLLAMSAACLILSKITSFNLGAAESALLVLIEIIGIIAAVIAAVYALVTEYPELVGNMGLVVEALEQVGAAIGGFFGNLVGSAIGGLAEGITSVLPDVATNLSDFMEKIQPFIDGVSQIDESFATSIGILIAALNTLGSAGVWENFTNQFSGDNGETQITKMLGYFGPLGEAIAAFSTGVGDLKADTIATAATAVDSIISLINSVVGVSVSDEDIEAFKTSCTTYAEDIAEVAATLEEHKSVLSDITLFRNAASAGSYLSEFAKTIPRTGGWAQTILGETDLAGFGESCKKYANYMVKVAETLKENASDFEDMTIFENAVTAGTYFSDFAKTIPETGGWAQMIMGESDIALFGASCAQFAQSICTTASKLSNNSGLFEDMSIFENAVTAAGYFTDFAETVPQTGGFWQTIAGTTDIADFGEKCKQFAISLVSVCNSFRNNGFSASHIEDGAKAGEALTAMAETVPSATSGHMSLTTFGSHLEKFGASLATYYDDVQDVDTGKLSAVSSQANKMISVLEGVTALSEYNDSNITSLLTNLGSSAVEGFVSAFDGSYESVTGAVSTLLGYFTSSVSDQQPTVNAAFKNIITSAGNIFSASYTRFSALGHMVMYKFRDGAYDTLSSVKAKFTTMMNNIYEVLRLRYNSFYNVGVYLVKGFAKGINDSTYLAKNAAKDMADAAAKSAKSTLAEKSPSKVGYGIGAYFGQGFVNGIVTFEQVAYDTASDLGDMATSGLNSTLSKIADFVDFSIDAEPTIRPILDLSDVDSGASTIGNMLSGTRTLSINTDTARLTATSMNRIQNDTNGELLSAIRDLGKSMSGRTGNVYNVNGVTYDDGSNISTAVQSLIRAARIERRV